MFLESTCSGIYLIKRRSTFPGPKSRRQDVRKPLETSKIFSVAAAGPPPRGCRRRAAHCCRRVAPPRIREAAFRGRSGGTREPPPGLKILRKKRLFITKNVFFCCTKLKTCVPEAKFIKESDFHVKTRLSPPKSAENCEKRFPNRNFLPKIFVEKIFSASKNRKLQIV